MTDDRVYRVSVKVVVYRTDGTILAMRRGASAPTRPLEWDIPGGELEYGENLEDAARRETREEAGIELGNLTLVDAIARFNEKGEFWTAMCYAAEPAQEHIELSTEHDQFEWVTPEKFQEIQLTSRNREFVASFALMRSKGII